MARINEVQSSSLPLLNMCLMLGRSSMIAVQEWLLASSTGASTLMLGNNNID